MPFFPVTTNRIPRTSEVSGTHVLAIASFGRVLRCIRNCRIYYYVISFVFLFITGNVCLPPVPLYMLRLNSGKFSKNLLLVYNMHPFLTRIFRSKLCVLCTRFYGNRRNHVKSVKLYPAANTQNVSLT